VADERLWTCAKPSVDADAGGWTSCLDVCCPDARAERMVAAETEAVGTEVARGTNG
jgi:hypothetical protein